MELIGELFSIVAPVHICIAVGFAWARAERRFDTALVTDLIFQIGAPCLVFSSLVTAGVDAGIMLEMVGATLLALVCFGVVSAIVLRLSGLPQTSFLAPMIFANTGNMGLPIAFFAFGSEGLALAICVYATNAVIHFTAGQWLWSGSPSIIALARTPLAWAALLAAGVIALGIELPVWILRTTVLLGDFTIPLMQFTLGVTLGTLPLIRMRRSVGLSLLRIGMGVSVGMGLAWLLGLEGAARGVFILDCAMPVAIFNYLLAEKYQRSPDDVASAVIVSTLLSLITLPLIVAAVL